MAVVDMMVPYDIHTQASNHICILTVKQQVGMHQILKCWYKIDYIYNIIYIYYNIIMTLCLGRKINCATQLHARGATKMQATK